MSAVVFRCDGADIPREWRSDGPETVFLNTRGRGQTMNLRIEDLEHAFVGRLDGAAYDLVRVASYAYAADQTVSRGGSKDWKLERWERDLRLVVPVSDPDLWSSNEVVRALRDCLSFVTGDDWDFAFQLATEVDDRQLLLPEGDRNSPSSDVVVPFSGGMDSLATILNELTARRHPLLISHQSWGLIEGERRRLATELRGRFGLDGFSRLDAAIHRSGDEATERSRRSRSFLYSSLALVAGHRVGAAEVLLSDNGVVSLNLPINRQLIGTTASRSTHPKFISLLNILAQRVLDEPPAVRNPLWDKTRTEVATQIADSGHAELIGATLSCVNVQRRTRTQPHCGSCSQCVDRRFATLAAAIEEHDPTERYGLDIFVHELPEGDRRTTASSYVRFAREIDSLSDEGIVRAYPELIAALRAGSEQHDIESYVDMLNRHAESVLTVLAAQLERAAEPLARGALPAHSLLVMSAAQPAEERPETTFAHSASYDWVRLGDEEFTLTPTQARVVQNLHRAHEAGIPTIGTRDALAGVDSNATRMSEVFRNSNVIGRLIVVEKRGRYRLELLPRAAA